MEFLADLQGADMDAASALAAPLFQQALGTVGTVSGADTALTWTIWSSGASEALAGTSTSLLGIGSGSRDLAALVGGDSLMG